MYLFAVLALGTGFFAPQPVLIIAGAGAVLWGLFSDRIIARNIRKNYERNQQQEEVSYTFFEDGVRWLQSSGSGLTEWTDVCKYAETRAFFAIYISASQAYVIPRRLLTDSQATELRGCLDKHIGRKNAA
jgi:hypothetical protein